MVEPAPPSSFEVAEPNLLLELLIVVLDTPTQLGVIDQSMRQATGVGITAGLAELTPSETLDDLTSRADAALIAAKQSRSD